MRIRLPTALFVRPDRIVMTSVFTASLLAAWAMLPGESERVAMLERDGHSREALAILEQQFSAGDRRYRTLHQMLALYENEGDISKSRDILEAMVRERPRDTVVRRRLVQFYKNSQDNPSYVAALGQLIELRYSEGACRELIGHLRYSGDANGEQAALLRCRQKGYRRPEDLSRLAELIAADGDGAQAAGLLKSIDDLKRLKTVRERYQLLSLLVEQDQPKEAERRALRWIRQVRDDGMSIGLIDLLARSKYPQSAIEVAKDAGAPGDSISLTVAERLIEQNQMGPARLYLRGWIDKATTAEVSTTIRFVEAAITATDPITALKGAKQLGMEKLPGRVLQSLALALEQAGASIDAAEVRDRIARDGVRVAEAAPATETDGTNGVTAEIAGQPIAEFSQRNRTVMLVDPLETWRRTLFSSMADDAVRRKQALFVGPPPPHGYSPGHNRRLDARSDHRSGGAKFLKKTSRILSRAKANKTLRAKRAVGGVTVKSPANNTATKSKQPPASAPKP